MTVIPIAQYLAQFGKSHEIEPPEPPRDVAMAQGLDIAAADVPAFDLEEVTAQARQEGRAEAEAQFELELARERAEAEARLAAEREAWLAEEGGRLGTAMPAAFTELEARIADSVARILAPFLGTAMRQKMLAELVETLTSLLDGDAGLLKVTGPSSLLDALKQRLGPQRGSIEYLPAEGADIVAVAEHTVIETRLQSWIDRFQEAIEG